MGKKAKQETSPDSGEDKAVTPQKEDLASENAEEAVTEEVDERTPLEKAEDERDEYLGNWHRARADYQNLRRRTLDDVQSAVGRERSALLQELLTILDFLDMALLTPVENTEAQNLKTGVQMTRDQLMALLTRHRVAPMPKAEGKFDLKLQQAVATVETTDVEPGQVMEVVRTGFMIGDDVLRYAQVKVSAAPEPPEDDDDQAKGSAETGHEPEGAEECA